VESAVTDLRLSALHYFAKPGQTSNHLLICNLGAANKYKTAYKVMLQAASVIYGLFSKQKPICILMCFSEQAMVMHALPLAVLLTAVDSLRVS